ncbi:MAG: 50S ribosome-binding GTPase [Planctomycetes bacterium]|nr:50S ribosome-binding GTPase [Planctomycetota bacterium]
MPSKSPTNSSNPKSPPAQCPPSWHIGTLKPENHELPASLLCFRAPRSYTGQDTIELHTIGSPVLLGMIVEIFLAGGARRAEPGEFTARAFLAGKLDLSQVHAVAGLIAARSDMQLRAAQSLLHGALSQRANEAREELADLLSLVEGAMDFADEPIEFITADALRERLSKTHAMLSATIDAGHRAERWGGLPRVLLVGRPNAGKSSLLNALTGIHRAIASPIAGTTRDAISAPLNLGETECLLIDIAGLDDATNELDRIAQHLAHQAIQDADLILEVIDPTDPSDLHTVECATSPTAKNSVALAVNESAGESGSVAPANSRCHTSSPEENHPLPHDSINQSTETPRIQVANKSDLLPTIPPPQSASANSSKANQQPIPVSALTGHNLATLRQRIAAALKDRE